MTSPPAPMPNLADRVRDTRDQILAQAAREEGESNERRRAYLHGAELLTRLLNQDADATEASQ